MEEPIAEGSVFRLNSTWTIAFRWGFIELLSAIIGTAIYESASLLQSTVDSRDHGLFLFHSEAGLLLRGVVTTVVIAILSGRIIQFQINEFDKRRWLIYILIAELLVTSTSILEIDFQIDIVLRAVLSFSVFFVPVSQWLCLRQHLKNCLSWIFVPFVYGFVLASPFFIYASYSGAMPSRPWLVSFSILISPILGILSGLLFIYLLYRNGIEIKRPQSFREWIRPT